MANIITAGNSTNGGTAITTDTSGTLNIVTGSGSGSNAITIDASQNVAMTASQTIAGNLTVTGTITGTGGVSGGFGSGQTWTNVTGSRSVGTTYTNSTGKAIAWFIGMAGGYYAFVTIGGTSFSGYSNIGGTWIIPVGATYVVNAIQGGSIAQWMELR